MLTDFIASHPSLQAALPVLFDAAIKGAILVIIAAIAAYLLRSRSAASRHAVWTAAVVGHLAIPALVLILPAWTMPVSPARSVSLTATDVICLCGIPSPTCSQERPAFRLRHTPCPKVPQ